MDKLIDWVIGFMSSLGNLWDWLITPLSFTGNTISPLGIFGIGFIGSILVMKLISLFNPLS